MTADARRSFELYLEAAGPGQRAARARAAVDRAALENARNLWSGLLAPSTSASDVEAALGAPDRRDADTLAYDLPARPGYTYAFVFDGPGGRLVRSGYRRHGPAPEPPTLPSSPSVSEREAHARQLEQLGATEEELISWYGQPLERVGWWPAETWSLPGGLTLDLRHGVVEAAGEEQAPQVHYLIFGYPGSESVDAVVARLAGAFGVTFTSQSSDFFGGAYQLGGSSPAREQIVVHRNRDFPDVPSEQLLTRAPSCPVIIRFKATEREPSSVSAALASALGVTCPLLLQQAGRAPAAPGAAAPPRGSLLLGYPGAAGIEQVAAAVAGTLGVTLERRESDFMGGTYYRAGRPGSEEVYVHPNRDVPEGPLYAQAADCPLIIRVDGSGRDAGALVAELEAGLVTPLRRISGGPLTG